MRPTIGRIVHVNIGTPNEEVLRPAIIVAVWNDYCVNLQLILDGVNDEWKVANVVDTAAQFTAADCAKGMAWCTSVMAGDEVGNWRWPARD